MVLLRSSAPGVICAWYSPLLLVVLLTVNGTALPSSPATSEKCPLSTNFSGSLNVTKRWGFGEAEVAWLAGSRAVTGGGVPSRVTLLTSGPAGSGTVTRAPTVLPSGPKNDSVALLFAAGMPSQW